MDFLTASGLVRMSLQGKAGRFVPRFSPCPFAEGSLPSEAELRNDDESAKQAPERDPAERERQDLLRAIERERKRAERTLAAVREDIAAIGRAREDATKARAFVALASGLPAGTHELVAPDFLEASGAPLTLRIDPRIAPRVALERIFSRAKRLGARESFVAQRAASLEESVERFDELRGHARSADAAALAELRESFRSLARRTSTTSAARAKDGAAARAPHRTFVGAEGREVLVGRSAAKNTELTFRLAKGTDLWLHARDIEGAHVVVRMRRDEAIVPEVLLDAAHLAVHFSKAREEALVDVQYTHVGHLKKLPAPGAVIVGRERVLAVRVDRARTEALLRTER